MNTLIKIIYVLVVVFIQMHIINVFLFPICKDNDEGNPFSLTIESEGNIIERKCSSSFSETYKYYIEDKICLKEVDECEDLLIELDTNKCVESCIETQFKYYNKCRDNCPSGNERYISPNNDVWIIVQKK